MVKRVHVLVEGTTEETFVNMVLAPHLAQYNIITDATAVCTRRIQNRRAHRGGGSSYVQIKNDLHRLLRSDSRATAVTTMFDYYAFPQDIPGYSEAPASGCYTRVKYLEDQFYKDINDTRLIPNIVLHEFEALLFSDPQCIAAEFDGKGEKYLADIANSFDSPEKINDSPSTAPSKRLLAIYPTYQKVLHCSIIAPKIGLEKIRTCCSHFNEWLTKMENL